MRILLDYRPALRERTGVGEYVHQAARALVQSARTDESLTLFSSSYKDRLNASAIPGASVVDRHVPVTVLNFAWHRLRWPPVEQLAQGRFDVVQSFSPLLVPTRGAARLVMIHDLDFLDHPERSSAEIQRDYPALAAANARDADHIVVNSKHTGGDVQQRFGVPADHLSVCYPGAPDWPTREHEPERGCLLFLGSIAPRKNLGVLLDAYERLLAQDPRTVPLVLAGAQTAESRPLIDRVGKPPLAGHVEMPGYVTPEARRAFYERALVFVLPSHTEGFGMPAVEAMATGVPVVAANRGALPEVVGSAGRLVDPDDASGLAAVLHTLLADQAERRRLGDAGREQARRFSWGATAEGLRRAWDKAIEHRGRRRG